jgi:uncharacterized protein
MSRFSFKKIAPTPDEIRNSKSLQFLGALIHDPNLFHLNRRSVSLACFWGIFIGLMPPIPLHTPAAAAAALLVRCNLPLTLAIIWIGNPLTAPVIMYTFYYLGRLVLHLEPIASLEFSWVWLVHQFAVVWKPYLVGTLLGSSVLASAAYFIANFTWRLNVRRKWKSRERKRLVKK